MNTPSTNPPRESDRIDATALRMLAGIQGPCLTITIPGRRPGAAEGSRRAMLQNMFKAAREQLASSSLEAPPDSLLDPLEKLAQGLELDEGGEGLALFRSPQLTIHYPCPEATPLRCVVASHFWLVPFLATAYAPAEFFALALSKKRLRLYAYDHGTCREQEWPEGAPANLEEAGQFNRSERSLQNRKAAGSSVGAMGAVQFGNTSDRENESEYLHEFFVQVDRGLKEVLDGKPVLLLGVKESLAAFRRAAHNTLLLDAGIVGNPDGLRTAEIAERAAQAARTQYFKDGAAVLASQRELKDRSRTLDEPAAIVTASVQGRVQKLCVRQGTEAFGRPAPGIGPGADAGTISTAGRASLAGEDLLNAAVAATLHTGGEVYLLPPDQMAGTAPMAAILRY